MAFNTDFSFQADTMGTMGEPSIALPQTRRATPGSDASGVARSMGAAALDLLPEAVLVVDGTGQVVGTNRSADDMLGRSDGLFLDHGRLATRVIHDTRSLAQAIARVSCGAETSEVLRISRGSGQLPFMVTVASVPDTCGGRSSGTVLFVHDPMLNRVPEPSWLSRVYGLTPVEGKVASALAAGQSLQDIADERGISIQTVRGHLKQVFSKTGTHRQGELVARLLSGPPPLACAAA